MKKLFLSLFVLAMLASCGTKNVTPITEQNGIEAKKNTAPITYDVTPHPDVITIKEAISLLASPEQAKAIAKARGYKAVGKYGIYRLDNYSQMMFKTVSCLKTWRWHLRGYT